MIAQTITHRLRNAALGAFQLYFCISVALQQETQTLVRCSQGGQGSTCPSELLQLGETQGTKPREQPALGPCRWEKQACKAGCWAENVACQG